MTVLRRMPYFRSMLLWLGATDEWEIDVDTACARLDGIAEYVGSSAYNPSAMKRPSGVHVASGGDPFARPDDLARVLQRGADHGMIMEVATPALWAVDEATAFRRLQPFEGRLHLLTVRTGADLVAAHGVRPVASLIAAARRLDVNFAVLCHVGPGQPLPRELFAIEEINNDTAIVRFEPPPDVGQAGGTHDAGRAPAGESPEDGAFSLAELPRRRCRDLFAFTTAPSGEVFPCARGMGCDTLRLGDLRTDTAGDVIERAVTRPSLQKLRLEGPGFLYDACRAEAPAALRARYVDPCEFHRHALTDPVLARVVGDVMRRVDAAEPAAAPAPTAQPSLEAR